MEFYKNLLDPWDSMSAYGVHSSYGCSLNSAGISGPPLNSTRVYKAPMKIYRGIIEFSGDLWDPMDIYGAQFLEFLRHHSDSDSILRIALLFSRNLALLINFSDSQCNLLREIQPKNIVRVTIRMVRTE